MARSTFVYVTYIRTTPEKLWAALTEQKFISQYWFGTVVQSAWKAGSPWQMTWPDGTVADTGEVLESDPPRKLVIRWHHQKRPELHAEGASICTIQIETTSSAVKLSLTHSIEADPSKFIEAVSGGWPKILSNLKSLLETGTIALEEAYPKSDSTDRK
jgi:uncharacterized protein YndB with AHSA1/START domain